MELQNELFFEERFVGVLWSVWHSNVSEIAICREGQAILERVHDPAKWKQAIFYQDMQMDDTVMAFSTRTDTYRYN